MVGDEDEEMWTIIEIGISISVVGEDEGESENASIEDESFVGVVVEKVVFVLVTVFCV